MRRGESVFPQPPTHTQPARSLLAAFLLAAALTLAPAAPAHAGPRAAGGDAREVHFDDQAFTKLDTFEAHSLNKADDVFNKKDFRRAAAEYDAFMSEFPRSSAMPYALLRKARCLQLQQKRFEAVRGYQEVIDYFPNAVRYAAAAAFHIGQCHKDNGDEESAFKAWTRLADDRDYSRQPLAAHAVNELAEALAKRGDNAKAAQYFQQVAVDFRTSSPDAARNAIGRALHHLVRITPDEPALRAFYEKVRGFDDRPRRLEGPVEKERDYWDQLRLAVRRFDRFADNEAPLRARYYQYWLGAMDNRFPDWDEYQIDLAAFALAATGDKNQWQQRLDKQFDAHQKPGDMARVLRWIELYASLKPKLEQYYAKIDFAKMDNAQVRSLAMTLFDRANQPDMARGVLDKLRFDRLSDPELAKLAYELWKRSPQTVPEICARITDKDLAAMEALRFHCNQRDLDKAVPLADKLISSPQFAAEAIWLKADLLFELRQYQNAIAVYQQSDRAPDNYWRIAECHRKLKQYDQALAQLREIEGFFKQKDNDSRAALAIADVYRDKGEDKQYIAALRGVMKKYPKSPQSSEAHQRLEKLGVRIGGGVDAE